MAHNTWQVEGKERRYTICFTICLCTSPDFDGYQGTKNETLIDPGRPKTGLDTVVLNLELASVTQHARGSGAGHERGDSGPDLGVRSLVQGAKNETSVPRPTFNTNQTNHRYVSPQAPRYVSRYVRSRFQTKPKTKPRYVCVLVRT
jgi:hypothetical protein